MGVLTEHYGSLGRLADYRHQFEKTARKEGSIYFRNGVGNTARQSLRRHGPHCADIWIVETPIWDIVDRCHADIEARKFSKPGLERAFPIYTINEPGCELDDRMVAAVTIPPAAPDQLETLLR